MDNVVTSLTMSMSTVHFFLEISQLESKKIQFSGHMINRILHSWSFHMKLTTCVRSSILDLVMQENIMIKAVHAMIVGISWDERTYF